MKNSYLKGAFWTIVTLFGGLLAGIVLGDWLFKVLPGSSIDNPVPMHIGIAAVPALGGFLAGGAAWGVQMGRLANAGKARRMAKAGMWGFGPVALVLAIGLGIAEPPLVASFGNSTGIHRIFTLLFVPAAFLIAGISAWAIGIGLKDSRLARSLFWKVGLASGAAFLVINLAMERAGWVVGGPGAAERFTMVTVLAVGIIGSAIAGGAIIGKMLTNSDSGVVDA